MANRDGEKIMKTNEFQFEAKVFENKAGAWRYCDVCKKHMHMGDMFSRLYHKGKRVGAFFTTVDICSDCLEISM